MEICTTLNIQTGGAGGRTDMNGIQISCDNIADWLGVPHNTFSSIVTEFKNARAAHRLLRIQPSSLLPPRDLAFKRLLDALLGNTILEPPNLQQSDSSLAAEEAVSICIGRFNKNVREIICTYGLQEQEDD